MPELIFGHSEALARWMARQIARSRRIEFGEIGPCQAIGIAAGPRAEDRLYGVVAFHDYQPGFRTIQISAAAVSPRWATPGVIRALLHYPFVQLDVNKVWLAIPHDNERALRFNLGIGMKRDGTLRHHFGPGVHAVIVGMLRSEYDASRWAMPRTRERPNGAAKAA